MRNNYFYTFFFLFISFTNKAANLQQVWQDAINNSPELQQTAVKNAVVHNNVYEYFGTLLPQISIADASNTVKPSCNKGLLIRQSQQDVALNLTQTIFDMSKIYPFKVQQKNALLQDLAFKISQQKTTVNAIIDYLNVVSAADQLTTLQAQKTAIAKRLAMIKISVAQGLSTISDLENIQAKYDLLVAREIAQENTIGSALDKLSTVTGKRYPSLTGLRIRGFTAKVPEIGQINFDKLSASKLAIIQTRLNADSVKNQITETASGFIPIIDVSTTQNYSNAREIGLASESQQDNKLLKLSKQLDNGGSTVTSIKDAENNYVAASELLLLTKLTMLANFRYYYQSLKADCRAINAYQHALTSSHAVMESTNKSFDVGAGTIIDVLDAISNFYQTQQQLSLARYQYIMDIVKLQASLATIEASTIENINRLLGPEISLNTTADFE